MQMACLMPCSAATAYSALLVAIPRINQAIETRNQANLLVVGAGGLGLWCIKLAKALFPEGKLKISVVDITEEKIKVAKEAGADEGYIWGRNAKVVDLVQLTTKGGRDSIDAAINFVGTVKTTQTALECLHKGGILVLIGMFGGSMPLKIINLIMKCIAVVGNRASSLGELREVLELISKKELQYPNLEFFSLDEINQGLSKLRDGTVTGRGVVKFE